MASSDAGPGPPAPAGRPTHEAYTLHPLIALDGVLILVTSHGEAVGYHFGKTEEAAAASAATHLLSDGTS